LPLRTRWNINTLYPRRTKSRLDLVVSVSYGVGDSGWGRGRREGRVGRALRTAERQPCNSDSPPLTSRFVACVAGGLMFPLAAGWQERASGSRVAESAMCGCSAVGSASPCQGEGRGFESRHPLERPTRPWLAVWPSGEATACKAVHTGSIPVAASKEAELARLAQRESASLTRKRSLVQSQYRALNTKAGQPRFRPGLTCFFRVQGPVTAYAVSGAELVPRVPRHGSSSRAGPGSLRVRPRSRG
jgi:hypothetical protein